MDRGRGTEAEEAGEGRDSAGSGDRVRPDGGRGTDESHERWDFVQASSAGCHTEAAHGLIDANGAVVRRLLLLFSGLRPGR